MRDLVGNGIFILDQLIDNNDEFSFSLLKHKYHLSVATQWQHLQLQHLWIAQFAAAAVSASETLELLKGIINPRDKKVYN